MPPQVDHDVEIEESSIPPPPEGRRAVSSASDPSGQNQCTTARQRTLIKEESNTIALLYDVATWEAKESELKVCILMAVATGDYDSLWRRLMYLLCTL